MPKHLKGPPPCFSQNREMRSCSTESNKQIADEQHRWAPTRLFFASKRAMAQNQFMGALTNGVQNLKWTRSY